jgi:hypothetical protein
MLLSQRLRKARQIRLKIGDITLALISGSSDCEFQVEERWEGFVTDDQPDIILHIHCGCMPNLEFEAKVFDTSRSWSVYRSRGRRVVYVRSPTLDPYQLAVLEPDFFAGDIYVRASEFDPSRFRFPLRRPMGEVFMINLLSRGHGVLLHACGVKNGERGLVFAGAGGAGKSTIARLWEGRDGVRVLSGDRVILRQKEGHYWVYGTPWPGQEGISSPDAVPFEQVFLIQHASENRVIPLSPADAASRLLVHSYPTFWDAEGMAFTLEFLGQLSQTVPCYELGFVPDESVIDFVRCLT